MSDVDHRDEPRPLWRRRLTERMAGLVNAHPRFASGAADIGLVDKAWLEDPQSNPVRTAPALDVVQRFLERSVEQEPSIIAELGLNALQLLTDEETDGDDRSATQELTVMFTDLAEFTRFTAERGDAEARDLLDAHHRVCGPVIRSRGGRIVKRLGDGMLVTFGAPEGAVLAALELRAANATGLALRVGAHHGEVALLRQDVVGQTVNVAARVTDAAEGDEILVTESVAAAAEALPGVEVGPLVPRSFKGVSDPVRVATVDRHRALPA